MMWIHQLVLALFVVLVSVLYRTLYQTPLSFHDYIRGVSKIDPVNARIALPPRFIPIAGDSLRQRENVANGDPLKIVKDPAQAGFQLSLAFFGRQPRLYVHDGQLAAKLLKEKDVGMDPFRKSRFSVMYPRSLITAIGELWKKYGLLFAPMFAKQNRADFAALIADLVPNVLNDGLVDFSAAFKVLAARVIGASAFGNRLESEGDAERVARTFTAMYTETAKYMNTLPAQLPLLRCLPTMQRLRATWAANACRAIVGGFIDDRKNGKTSPLVFKDDFKDFADIAVQQLVSGEMTRKEVLDNGSLLVIAGHETTAYAMAWTLALMANDASVYEQCRDEVRRVMADDADVTLKHLEDMHYLRATMTEALRLFPPVAFIERLMKNEFEIVEGVKLRKNTSLTVDVYGVHHDPKNWPDPERALPERHLDADGQYVTPDDTKFLPFSAGGRQCPGRKFAQNEIIVVMATILRHNDLELEKPDMKIKLGITISPLNPIRGHLKPIVAAERSVIVDSLAVNQEENLVKSPADESLDVEEIPAESPVVEEISAESPVVEETSAESPVVEQISAESPVVEETSAESPVVEEESLAATIVGDESTGTQMSLSGPVFEHHPVAA